MQGAAASLTNQGGKAKVRPVPQVKKMKAQTPIPFSEPALTQSTADDIHGAGATQMKESQREVRSASFHADNSSSLWSPAQSCTIKE